jgi:preprotein translocase subunit SecB
MNEQTQNTSPHLEIQRIYVKDISLETPGAPDIFRESSQPAISMDLDIAQNKIADRLYEIVLTITVSAKAQDRDIFLVEVRQAGIFQLTGFNEAQLESVLNAYLPSLLFPYAREVVSDLVTRASFPQLILAPVNFDLLYAQKKQAAQQ